MFCFLSPIYIVSHWDWLFVVFCFVYSDTENIQEPNIYQLREPRQGIVKLLTTLFGHVCIRNIEPIHLVRDSSAVPLLFVRLAGAVGRQSTLHKQNSGFAGPAHFHVSWLSDFIFYPKPLYKSLHQSFFYSFITYICKYPQKVVLHSITARFPFRPYDLVISLPFWNMILRYYIYVTERWQQRIAW